MVPLSEELENVKNYCKMQEIRFPDKAILFSECADEVKDVQIPRCLLLTIAENSYKYAMGVNDVLQILIDCRKVNENGKDFALISIEDNGKGFTDEQLAYYNGDDTSENTAGHVGLLNIKETLKLTYKADRLLSIENAVPEGAKTLIRIPIKSEG